MVNAGAEFHKAVYAGSPAERIMMRFGDTFFTNEDVEMNAGVQVIEALNFDDELTIGACPASTLEATILNPDGLLSNFQFGDCEVLLGVQTQQSTVSPSNATVMTVMRPGTSFEVRVEGYSTEPYLRINGAVSITQPPFAVAGLLAIGNTLYCTSERGGIWAASWVDGETWYKMSLMTWGDAAERQWGELGGMLIPITEYAEWEDLAGDAWDDLSTLAWEDLLTATALNDFMKNKLLVLAKAHRGMTYLNNFLYEYQLTGSYDRFEFVKLGTFVVDTPKKRKTNLIAISASDRMSMFDVVIDEFLDGLAYPTTLGDIFHRLCAYIGIPAATQSFINSGRIYPEPPMQTEGVTGREILGWIAEAACSIARMTRDGEVELAWFSPVSVNLAPNQYFALDVAEYDVPKIETLKVASSQLDVGVVIGDGWNAYQIVDNPFLYGENDTEIRTAAVPIYNRLISYAAFRPVNARTLCDWSIQAGDIISIEQNGAAYAIPIYVQTITWNGSARVTYESTGSAERPPVDIVNRRIFNQRRATHELQITVNGINSRLESTEGDVATLDYQVGQFSLTYVNKNGVISSINQSAEAITINASKLNLVGYTTFTDLSTPGKTTISGSNITTGVVSASRIDVDNLYVKHLDGADGSFTGTLTAYTTQFNTLEAGNAYNLTRLGGGVLQLGSNIWLGYVAGYNDYSMIPSTVTTQPGRGYGNIGVADHYWDYLLCYNIRYVNSSSSASSIRYKTDVRPLDWDGIDCLRPITYALKNAEDGARSLGFIAEEVEEVCPMLVTYNDMGAPDGLCYDRITVLLVDEVKRLRERVSKLEKEALN